MTLLMQWNITFSGFSVSCCINREKGYLLPTWAQKITCRHFNWMLQSSSGWKWKKCEQMLLFIAMHYWGYTSWEVKGCEDCSSLPASSSQQSSNQGLPVLHLGWSTPTRMSSGCAGPPSPTAPVLCYGPIRWSIPSGSRGGSLMHAPLQPTSPSSSSCRYPGVPLVSSPVSFHFHPDDAWSIQSKHRQVTFHANSRW